ncbi:MAG: DNA repair protein RecO [Chloroflexota bacterium]
MTTAPRSLQTEAVILRHFDLGEADRILALFTPNYGKLRAVAKGVRKLLSRKAGHLEPLSCSKLLLSRGQDLYIITQAEMIEGYQPLREDLIRFGNASYAVELLDRFTFEGGENRSLYRLLKDTLWRLTVMDDFNLIIRYYEIRLLDLLGFRPQLFRCVGCKSEIRAEDQYFSAEQGGVLCPKCGRDDRNGRPISMSALKFLRHYQRSSFEDASRASIPSVVQTEMENLMHYYLTHLLERSLNTPSFLRRVREG